MGMRVWLAWLALAFSGLAADAQTLTYRSCARLPERSTTGLSSISFTGADDVYWGALEWASVLDKLNVKLNGDGSIASAEIVAEIPLAQKRRDLEGIAFTSAMRGSVIVSDESAPGITEI